MPEITEPLSDEELRDTAENGWAPHGARLAGELIAARARVTQLEASVDTFVRMTTRAGETTEKICALVGADPEDAGMVPTVVDRVVAEHLALRKRAAELEAFVADIASQGLRCDLNPTMDHSTPEKYADGMLRYLRMVDESLRAAARRFVPDADRPHIAGRPIPTPRVEVVAESVTELDLLRAQDGDR